MGKRRVSLLGKRRARQFFRQENVKWPKGTGRIPANEHGRRNIFNGKLNYACEREGSVRQPSSARCEPHRQIGARAQGG